MKMCTHSSMYEDYYMYSMYRYVWLTSEPWFVAPIPWCCRKEWNHCSAWVVDVPELQLDHWIYIVQEEREAVFLLCCASMFWLSPPTQVSWTFIHRIRIQSNWCHGIEPIHTEHFHKGLSMTFHFSVFLQCPSDMRQVWTAMLRCCEFSERGTWWLC